jgi:type IV pilus assembly protein PilQ
MAGTVVDNPNAAGVTNNGYNVVGTRTITNPNNTSGLNIGVVTNNVAVFVNALESISDSTVLANPKVLTLNKQAGTVIVGRKDGYITTTATSTTTVQSVEFLETGTRLVFRPYISSDGFVRMEIHPEDSTGQVQVTGAFALPSKQTTEVTTNVLVKDGHTIVIGGLFREDNSITKSQVPLLGDIPLAGALFRNQADRSNRQEVIVLLTPHIIKDHEMYSEASAEMMKHIDLMRVGLRKGMMPWSRDRLAEMCYKTARDEASKKYYDRDRVMWYLDCATSLNPDFSEALVMKQQISGQQMMESDNSSIRHFVTDLIMEDKSGQVPAVEPAAPATQPVPETVGPVTVPPAQQTVVAPKPAEAPVAPKPAETPVIPAPAPAPAPAVPPEAAPAPAPAPVSEPQTTQPVAPDVKELPTTGSAENGNK